MLDSKSLYKVIPVVLVANLLPIAILLDAIISRVKLPLWIIFMTLVSVTVTAIALYLSQVKHPSKTDTSSS